VIDQHAAHERVVYEALIRQSRQKEAASQRLLMPDTLDLGFRETDTLNQLLPALQRVGFDLSPFGGDTWAISSVPALLAGVDAAPIVKNLIEKTLESGQKQQPDRLLEPVIQRIACHDAIRANHDLDVTEMKTLLKQLSGCENPSHCPHGRPLWLLWTPKDLEKAFKRVV
jgi:DNA mismatch repair protein MutL